MSYRELRQALLRRLGISPQALSQRAARLKRTYGPMSTETAICWIAVDEGLDISRFLQQAAVDRIRELRIGVVDFPPATPRTRKAGPSDRVTEVAIGKGLKVRDPILPRRIIDDAKVMAGRVYPLLYIFENSVREVIQQVMSRALGARWWATAVPKDIVTIVAKRMTKEEKNAWHGKRAGHPIYYADMSHLKQIVTSYWHHFAPLFPDQAWFTSRLDAIAFSRNVVDHHNPLAKDDIKGLEVYTLQWHKQVADCVGRGLLQHPGPPQR